MGETDAVRYCACGTRLARDNRASRCGACTRAGRRHPTGPSEVPVGFWNHPPLRRALFARDMGAVIRVYRTHPHHGHPIRQETVAAWIGLSSTRLSRIENGEPVNDLTKLMRWAELLRIPHDLLWFRLPDTGDPARKVQAEQRREQPPGGLHLQVVLDGQLTLVPLDWGSIATSDLASRLDRWIMDGVRLSGVNADPVGNDDVSISRRSFLLQGTAVFIFPALGPDEVAQVDKAMADPRRFLDREVVGHLGRQLREAMAYDGRQGPKKTLPVALGLLEAIRQVARDVKPDIRRQLLSIGARAAEFAGWLYRDAQAPEQASFWRDRATEWAQEVNDTSMQGYILLKKAQAAYDERDALRMLTLSQAAQSGPWSLPVRVRAEAAQQEARAHAMLGVDDIEVDRKLDEAHHLLADAESSGTDEALGGHYNATLLAM
ncbi:helix-turn-helix domain-containing protein [Saccharothrix longispora]|uniref:Transcriptional regulator with XRE-family HTH domain n=1 Tax=Saccharothrix longispora TaxID=33920 RepID=A0ABU1PSH4_9PSEU|nr:helix-turn-helix transcriptional regulator [Saccharothrix longispora]MDR6593598.1 transcriptional regulator with XRE-family HTH domain [Saccharothrix longispora]